MIHNTELWPFDLHILPKAQNGSGICRQGNRRAVPHCSKEGQDVRIEQGYHWKPPKYFRYDIEEEKKWREVPPELQVPSKKRNIASVGKILIDQNILKVHAIVRNVLCMYLLSGVNSHGELHLKKPSKNI